MSSDDRILGKLENSLEEVFFRKQEHEALEKIRSRQNEGEAALADSKLVSDDKLVSALASVNMQPETLVALSMVPLVLVAWADEEMEASERKAILKAAEAAGIAPGTASYEILEDWMNSKPGPEVYAAWQAYIGDLKTRLGDDMIELFRDECIGRARTVAKSAGGMLGVGAVSDEEQAVLDKLSQVF